MRNEPAAGRGDLREWCEKRLEIHKAAALSDPLASGVRMLTIDLWDAASRGEITREDIFALAVSISDEALKARAGRLHELARRGDWRPLVDESFARFEGAPVEDVAAAFQATQAGIVFTAHPTFALRRPYRDAIGAIAGGAAWRPDGGGHASETAISLTDEHQAAAEAITRAQTSLRALWGACYDWLAARHPSAIARVTPSLLSLASWVGYDLDGRTDIHWAATLRFRLIEKAEQLRRYAAALDGVAGADDIAQRLTRAAAQAERTAGLFTGDLDDPARIVAAANSLTEKTGERLTSLRPIVAEINRLIESATGEAKRRLFVLRAEMAAFGLGIARIHLRVNAAQIRSALRADLGLAPGRDFLDRTALGAASKMTAAAQARDVNFGAVAREQMTARRQLMLCAQILKHIDEEMPIRFLIAEVEAPATIMGAVYLARLYGVADKIDISPLFETPGALERGGRFIERLLDDEEYIQYIRDRGRISIQCGFSDSGRFMGQVAADMAMERLHILISRALSSKGVKDIEVVIFNTHGESMGRGGHPGGFKKRLDHLMTPWARARYAYDNLRLNAECSFQGGDGFLHFQSDALAEASVQEIFRWAQTTPERHTDRFYSDINYSWDVYRTIKSWQESLFENRDYQRTVSAFAHNFLPPSGSRKTRRQSGASKDDISRSLRAIPHNAILQQFAAPANVLGGMGSAAASEPERFAELVQNSPRIRGLLEMTLAARKRTSLAILRTYASLYDPGFWTVRAARATQSAERVAPLLVADRLADRSLDVSLNRLANVFSVDRQKFDDMRRNLGDGDVDHDAFAPALYILHAARMAIVSEGFVLAASTPTFSARHDFTRELLIDFALDLRFAELADVIDQIFPESAQAPPEFSQLSEPGSPDDAVSGYPWIKAGISDPLRRIDAQIKHISVGISHFYDAFG